MKLRNEEGARSNVPVLALAHSVIFLGLSEAGAVSDWIILATILESGTAFDSAHRHVSRLEWDNGQLERAMGEIVDAEKSRARKRNTHKRKWLLAAIK